MFEVEQTNGEIVYVDNPSKLPEISNISDMREPIVQSQYTGATRLFRSGDYPLCIEKRGVTGFTVHGQPGFFGV